ncbi:MAG: lamin tail domain-containing protein, partial [Candidatus Eisenbacteria bacterium]|nr:lamin tail domain-containing protein [Candidatus Eisenbacteria bacterium]
MFLATALAALALLITHSAPGRVPVFAAADAPLRLNEILPGPARDWDGSGVFSSRDDEWVELVNTGAAPLDLAAFFITDGDTLPRCGLSGTLAGNARLVVFGRDAYAWERANGFPAYGLSLSNSGDRVMLWQVSGGDTLLVDEYAYTSHEAAADRAIGRLPEGIGGWQLFDGLNP